jgi:hypothetical protein
MSNQTFKQFIQSYDQDTIQDIADHGCASACVSGMIYYQETTDLYDLHCVELHEALDEYKECMGEWPSYVTDNLGCASLFKNSVVWLVAEIYAQELTNA